MVGVDDVDATHARCLARGGMDAMAPTDMPGVGRAYLLDPDNNVFGLTSSALSDGTEAM